MFGIPHLSQDLISVGYIGLMDACKKFNPDKGAQFVTYASLRIKGAIRDFLRSEYGAGRKRVWTEEGEALQEVETVSLDGWGLHAEIGGDGQVNRFLFWSHIEQSLTPRHWQLVDLCYRQGHTLAQAGDKLGVTAGRVHQLREEALEVLHDKARVLLKENISPPPILKEGKKYANKGG